MKDSHLNLSEKVADTEFQRLLEVNQRRVFGYILTLIPVLEDAKEIFQNTCVVILKKTDDYTHGSDFAKWACQIAYFEVCNFRRQRKRQAWTLDSDVLESLASKHLEGLDSVDHRRSALVGCLGKLTASDRELIELRYSRDVTSRQLASELARPAASVYKSLSRIRHVLERCIERTLAGEERR